MSGVHHDPLSVILTCRDVAKSLAFYRDVLGFVVENQWPDQGPPMWVNLMMGSQSVMLGAAAPPDVAASFCKDDPAGAEHNRARAEDFQKNKSGVGVAIYVGVPDIDAYYTALVKKGQAGLRAPKTQFYGIRELAVRDPDGYEFLFYSQALLASCGSCGMPLTDAKAGQMYCKHCTDESGKLRPYAQVLEGTISGYFMALKKLPRTEAETAARAHLAKMPAWHGK
jgi:catechol 2,3-dioxygenase-like lactoylglutathione lyase family enzyme